MIKKCLLGLFVGFVGLTCFSNSYYLFHNDSASTNVVEAKGSLDIPAGTCLRTTTSLNGGRLTFYEGDTQIGGIQYSYDLLCFSQSGRVDNSYTASVSMTWFDMNLFTGNCPECEECQECPEVDTGAILSGSCDINYCVENGLCPTSSGSRSELKINDIVHEGKPLINISIPDYIFWDYATDENQFDLYVGSGYNQDYIDSILAINSYRPDNEDFTNIFVSGLTLIFPYIFVALLIVFIWKLLKRIFK